VSFGVTTNPTAEWISRQITEAFQWDHAPRYLIRDRDTSYGPVFVQRLRAMGIRDRPIAFRSPWQNAYAERLIGSIRRECLDHMIAFGEAHLRRIVDAYAAYYNESRTHSSLNNDAPFQRTVQRLASAPSHHNPFSVAFTTNIVESNFGTHSHPHMRRPSAGRWRLSSKYLERKGWW
jgi:Integrase core domain